jgi:putative metallohydrolase (TIGR04338 family)
MHATTATRSGKSVKRAPAKKAAKVTNSRRSTDNTRDIQQTKVYRAEKMAQHLLLGDYWVQTMTELQVLELMERVLNHPGVIARWGQHTASVSFPNKGNTAWAERNSGKINLPPGTRNPLTVLHEVSHLLATSGPKEADHGPGFVSIYRYIVALVLGDEPSRVLDAAFRSLGVKSDDTRIPPVRSSHSSGKKGDGVPGLLPGQAAQASDVLRMAAAAGLFGEKGDPLRSAAYGMARRLSTVEKKMANAKRKSPIQIPETVTVPVASLLVADDRSDVAELVLSAVRKSMEPNTMTPPVDPQEKRAAARKKARRKIKAGGKR